MKGLSPSSWLKEHALLRAHTWTESWKGKGRAHWTQIFKVYDFKERHAHARTLEEFIRNWPKHSNHVWSHGGRNFCVDLHNQCDNIINQCYFIFALWSIMGLDTYCYLIFYELTLIHLTNSLSEVVQIMCVMCDIYIYKCKWKGSLLLLGWKSTHSWEHTLGMNLEKEREELIKPEFSHHH